MPEHPTLTGMAQAGFRSAAGFYYWGGLLDLERANGATEEQARATLRARFRVTEEQLDYICSFLPRRAHA
jgi:hypothetical protein